MRSIPSTVRMSYCAVNVHKSYLALQGFVEDESASLSRYFPRRAATIRKILRLEFEADAWNDLV